MSSRHTMLSNHALMTSKTRFPVDGTEQFYSNCNF
jgi:hypothetical protein